MDAIRDILKIKGAIVHTIAASATVLEAAHFMNQHGIGSVVVARDGRVEGIFTERDVLRRVVEDQRRPAEIPLSEVMIRNVICCSPDTTVEEARRIIKDRRIRHLPVCGENGSLMGLVSIGDLNAYHLSSQEATINHLHEFIYGAA